MQAKLSIVPIDQLSLFIGKKVRRQCWTELPLSDQCKCCNRAYDLVETCHVASVRKKGCTDCESPFMVVPGREASVPFMPSPGPLPTSTTCPPPQTPFPPHPKSTPPKTPSHPVASCLVCPCSLRMKKRIVKCKLAYALVCVRERRRVSQVCVCVMQAGIDMMGVVTNVGQLGSVKRKSDNSELSRRDITLLDQRLAPPPPPPPPPLPSCFPLLPASCHPARSEVGVPLTFPWCLLLLASGHPTRPEVGLSLSFPPVSSWSLLLFTY